MHRIPLDRFQTIISVSADSLVDGEETQFETVVVALVECFQDGREDGTIFAATCADRDAFAGEEEVCAGDCSVDFCFENLDEAFAAEFVAVFRSDDYGASIFAVETGGWRHGEGVLGFMVNLKELEMRGAKRFWFSPRRPTGLPRLDLGPTLVL